MVDLSDVSALSFWERQGRYLNQFGGENIVDREAVFQMANFAAQAEMLDEIHIMLRHLTGIENENVGIKLEEPLVSQETPDLGHNEVCGTSANDKEP